MTTTATVQTGVMSLVSTVHSLSVRRRCSCRCVLGTGACPNTTFYCKNAGHIGAVIPSTRVNDGKCGECAAW